jgi:hypothetical protein
MKEEIKNNNFTETPEYRAAMVRALADAKPALINFAVVLFGIVLLWAAIFANLAMPMPYEWNVGAFGIGGACVIGSHLYGLHRFRYLAPVRKPVLQQIGATVLVLGFFAPIGWILSTSIVESRYIQVSGNADSQFVAGNYTEAGKLYSALMKCSAEEARHARNTEKLALSQLLQSQYEEGTLNLRRAQLERLTIFRDHYKGRHDHEYSDDSNCQGQVDYLARIQTNLALSAGRQRDAQAAWQQEQSIAAEIRALPKDVEGKELLERYLHGRLDSVQRVGNEEELKHVLQSAEALGMPMKPSQVAPNSWMNQHQIDVGASTAKRALYHF